MKKTILAALTSLFAISTAFANGGVGPTSGSSSGGSVSQANGPWTMDMTKLNSTILGSPTVWGTAPSGNVAGVNANTSVTLSGPTAPTSVLTRPANTTAYASGQFIASSVTAGSVVVPSFNIANIAGSAIIPKIRLATSATTGWGTTLTMTLWTGTPTYTNGDGGTYTVATSNNGKYFLGQYTCVLNQFGDGAAGECNPTSGSFNLVTLTSGTAVYWDLQTTAAVTPISGQTFTVTAEVLN